MHLNGKINSRYRFLWELNLTLSELINLNNLLGTDVPFSMMGQAKCNKILGRKMNEDPMAACCALASGTGTVLKPIAKSFKSYMVLSKPPISVSTAEIYKGVDEKKISVRPDNKLLVNLLESDIDEREKKLRIKKNMINVLENIAEKRYPIIVYTKNKILKTLPSCHGFKRSY